jgi:hypothetical protein
MPSLIASVGGVEIRHVHLDKDRTTLGRRPTNDIVFDNLVVSGEHCVFELKGIADVYLEDLKSTNGTYVNGHMLKTRQLLKDLDLITIGNFTVQFVAASHREPVEAPRATQAMSLDALGFPGTSGERQASLMMLSGTSTGLEIPVVKAVTTFGQPGVSVISISHRRDGYYVAQMGGDSEPTLNGKPLGSKAVALSHNDVLNLGGTEMAFLLRNK